jgi:membrane protease YdiL (CAAX protease family)
LTNFQSYALATVAIWLAMVAIRYRRSTIVLTGGMLVVSIGAVLGLIENATSFRQLGLAGPMPWLTTLAIALVWLALMLAYSPLADRIATRMVAAPPNLRTFRAIQQSTAKLVMGIVVAWILGGFLEELIFRGIVLQSIEALMMPLLPMPLASAIAIVVAAIGAGIIHLYQRLRAALIITQLSMLFGLLFVISGHNLWTVILCHGLYDTIAFIRFATGKSRYSKLDSDAAMQA